MDPVETLRWRAPGLCVPVPDARLSHTHHSAERRGGALLPGALATAGAGQDWSPVGPGPTAARRWPPPACSGPRPQVGAGRGGWVPCGACLLRAGTVSLHLRTLVWGLFLATDEEETEGLRGRAT